MFVRRLPCYEPLFPSWTYLLGLPPNALWNNKTQKSFINSPTKEDQHGNCQASCQSLRSLQTSFSCVFSIPSPARHFSSRTLKRGLPGSGDFPSIKEQGFVWYGLWLHARWSEFLTFWNSCTQLREAGTRSLAFYKIILMSQSWFSCQILFFLLQAINLITLHPQPVLRTLFVHLRFVSISLVISASQAF